MSLTPDDLNDLDGDILAYLAENGRASPTLFKRDAGVDTSRQWVSSRFVRLEEHDHVEELHETGVYQLVDDPRTEDSDDVDLEDRIMVLENQLESAIAERDDNREELAAARERAGELAERVVAAESIDRNTISDAVDYLERALEQLPENASGRMAVEDAHHTLSDAIEERNPDE